MGIDSAVYVGPFIRVPGVRKTVKNETVRCSKGCVGKPAADARFCSHCGAPVARADAGKVELRRLHPSQVAGGEYEDVFWSPEYCSGTDKHEAVWISNSGHGTTFHEHGGDSALTLDLDTAEEAKAFAEEYKALLAAIEAEYGVTPVACWGIVPYAS
jgi:hypothetical protein